MPLRDRDRNMDYEKSKHNDSTLKETVKMAAFLLLLVNLSVLALYFLMYKGYNYTFDDKVYEFSDSSYPGDASYATIGYAKTINDPIEVFGRGTDKTLKSDKCEEGVCFHIDSSLNTISLKNDTIFTGSNECTNSWGINLSTEIVFADSNYSILSKIDGKTNPKFLTAVKENNKLDSYHNRTRRKGGVELPVYTTGHTQLFAHFYEEESNKTDAYFEDIKNTVKEEMINTAIMTAYEKPYEQSVAALQSYINKDIKSSLPSAYSVDAVFQAYDIDGLLMVDDTRPNSESNSSIGFFLGNDTVKRSFDCIANKASGDNKE